MENEDPLGFPCSDGTAAAACGRPGPIRCDLEVFAVQLKFPLLDAVSISARSCTVTEVGAAVVASSISHTRTRRR
eukprot:1284704-Amphidinium_carterae.1